MIRNKSVEYIIEIYTSKESRDLGATPIDTIFMSGIDFSHIIQQKGDDLIGQIYNFSKIVVPEYRNKEDLLDV